MCIRNQEAKILRIKRIRIPSSVLRTFPVDRGFFSETQQVKSFTRFKIMKNPFLIHLKKYPFLCYLLPDLTFLCYLLLAARLDFLVLSPARLDFLVLPPARRDCLVLPPARLDFLVLPPARLDCLVLPPTRLDFLNNFY